jgi:CDP-glucose 4,6-dehydratase
METFFPNVYKGKTVLVTGDTGFKGSWLAIWLLQLGAQVIGYGLKPKTTADNYPACGLEKHINHFEADIRDYDSLIKVIQEQQPEIVFHLAAQSLVLESYKDPVYTHSTNIMGTVNLLEAVRACQSVKAVINVTSDKCYENKEWLYGYREPDPLGGKDPYSASKAAAEIITNSYLNSFFSGPGTANVSTARAGNVIGGGDFSENRIFVDCIKALEQGKPVIIRNPDSVRPWQHVLEPLGGYLTLGAELFSAKKFSGAWNFGPLNRRPVTVRGLVEEVIRHWGSGEYIIESVAGNFAEASLLQLDISKALNKLNWHPVLDFGQTIKYAVEEYRINNLSVEEVFRQRTAHIKSYSKLRTESDKSNGSM